MYTAFDPYHVTTKSVLKSIYTIGHAYIDPVAASLRETRQYSSFTCHNPCNISMAILVHIKSVLCM